MLNLTFSTKIVDFNKIANHPEMIRKLRGLTLHSHSGMNCELNNLMKLSKARKVNSEIFLAFVKTQLVGWALYSNESSKVVFTSYDDGDQFNSGYGSLFQIFIDPKFRKMGIGTELVKIAAKKSNNRKICICPWDNLSTKFFSKFNNLKMKKVYFKRPSAYSDI